MHLLQARLTRNLLSNGSANLIVALLQMLILAVFARTLPVSVLAGYVLGVATIAVYETVSDFGTRHWAIRELSKCDTRQRFRQAVQLKMLFTVITILLGVITLVLFQQPVLNVALMILIGITQNAGDPYLWRLRARQEMRLEARIVILNRLLISICVIVTGIYLQSLTAILAGWLICNALRIAYEMIETHLLNGWHSHTPENPGAAQQQARSPSLISLAKIIFWIGLSATMYALYYRLGVLYLERTTTDVIIATFGLFFSLASAATIASNTLANVYYPRVAKSAVSSDYGSVPRQLNQLLLIFGTLFLCGGIIGVFISAWVVRLYAGDAYAGTTYLQHLIPWIYLTGLASCLRMAILALSQERFELLINSIGLGLILLFIQLLPHDISPIHRVIAAYSLSEFAMCTLRILRLRSLGACPANIWLVLSGAGLLGLLILL